MPINRRVLSQPGESVRRMLCGATLATLVAFAPVAAQPSDAARVAELVDGLGVNMRVLMIGAHPDDESTELVAWLARGAHVETAYLSLTRGDGGQNLIGNELGEALGVVRTGELLAARRIDGAHQFFTRAFDFGFSRSADETFQHWPRDSVLKDVVTVVRSFRPHVIIAVFTGTPSDGHGHHQVSGILAREALQAAADTQRFPAAATLSLGPWQVLKLYRSTRFNNAEQTFSVNVGAYSPILGRSYAEVAGESRSQHKSQGFGTLQRVGARVAGLAREYVHPSLGQLPDRETSIFQGLDTTWNRFQGAASAAVAPGAMDSVIAALAAVRRSYDPFDPSQMIPAIGALQTSLRSLCGDDGDCDEAWLAQLPAQLRSDLLRSMSVLAWRANDLLVASSAVTLEASTPGAVVADNDDVNIRYTLFNRGRLPVTLEATRGILGGYSAVSVAEHAILPDSAYSESMVMDPTSDHTVPWWLAEARNGDLFGVGADSVPDDQRIADEMWSIFRVSGVRGFVRAPVLYRYADPVLGEVDQPVSVVPPVSVSLDHAMEYASTGARYERTLTVRVESAAQQGQEVSLSLQLPAGLTATPASRSISLPAGGAASVTFALSGSLNEGVHELRAQARVGRFTYGTTVTRIDYPHIAPRTMFSPAAVTIRAVDLRMPADVRLAYVPGVGDNVAGALRELGFDVTIITPSELANADLSRFRSVVVGPRAYGAHPELLAASAKLLQFARDGGTLVVQYGQYEMTEDGVMPYGITISRPHDRVTVEEAPVQITDGSSPLLNFPNRITTADFDGWVQERSLYMPRTHAPEYATLLRMNDPGEEPNDGTVLVTRLGSGTYVYTTLSFFRQLPAGVAGAARLFVNLISAGQNGG